MKKLTSIIALALLMNFSNVSAQARQELNFGLIGINYEIPVHEDITIAPGVGTDFNLNWVNLGVKGNYYFDNLFEITDDAWDVYAGVNAGYSVYIGNDHYNYGYYDNNGNYVNNRYRNNKYNNGVNLGLQVGGRWFWNDKWGVYAEIAGGNISGLSPGIGITLKL